MGIESLRVKGIYISPDKGLPMQKVHQVVAIEGQGLEGDRYTKGLGFWQNVPNVREGAVRQVTLISSKDIEEASREAGTSFKPEDTRRQILIAGDINLRDLIGKKFRIGDVEMLGVEECKPCKRPSELSGKDGFETAFRNRGGLRAQILNFGVIKEGQEMVVIFP